QSSGIDISPRCASSQHPVHVARYPFPTRRSSDLRALEREGYRALGAGSAETAYELLAAGPADAVLLDIRLPTMSGLAAPRPRDPDRKSTRLNSSHQITSYAVFCLKKKRQGRQYPC